MTAHQFKLDRNGRIHDRAGCFTSDVLVKNVAQAHRQAAAAALAEADKLDEMLAEAQRIRDEAPPVRIDSRTVIGKAGMAMEKAGKAGVEGVAGVAGVTGVVDVEGVTGVTTCSSSSPAPDEVTTVFEVRVETTTKPQKKTGKGHAKSWN